MSRVRVQPPRGGSLRPGVAGVIRLLAFLGLVPAGGARADAPSPLSGHVHSAAGLAEIREVEAGWEDGVLRLTTPSARLFARATMPAPPGGWDLSRRATVAARITNVGIHPAGVMFWVVGGRGWEAVVDQRVLEPGETRIFSCDLRARFPDGTPKLDPGHVASVLLMLGQPTARPEPSSAVARSISPRITRPIAVSVQSLEAHGTAPAWRRPPGRLDVPEVEEAPPAPGKRVRYRLVGDAGAGAYGILHLPEDWRPGGRYPVICEYPGNLFYGPQCFSSGLPDQCVIGYGITRGRGAICVGLPFVDNVGSVAEHGWGDPDATADYAVRAVRHICDAFGGDPTNVVLTGFSRGAIACGFIGLRNDTIAAIWKGFHACQHYDGDGWNGATMPEAITRAKRFRGVAVFQTDNPRGRFAPVLDAMRAEITWADSGLGFHSTAMFLDDRPSTAALRQWFWRLVTTAEADR